MLDTIHLRECAALSGPPSLGPARPVNRLRHRASHRMPRRLGYRGRELPRESLYLLPLGEVPVTGRVRREPLTPADPLEPPPEQRTVPGIGDRAAKGPGHGRTPPTGFQQESVDVGLRSWRVAAGGAAHRDER